MLSEFVEFAQSIFPSISPYQKESIKKAIDQFNIYNKKIEIFDYPSFDFLSQGDILDGIPFLMVLDNGEILSNKSKGMIISNTCSCDHDDDIVIAPLIPLEDLDVDRTSVMNNLYYKLFYLPALNYGDYVVDFSLMNTINKTLLIKMMLENRVKKEKTLNLLGFYILLTKLTICFMRPEDLEVQEKRKEIFNKQHFVNY